MATYHPAYLLRNPHAKADVWKDLQKVMAALGLPPKKAPRP
jgi:DNA polymerase